MLSNDKRIDHLQKAFKEYKFFLVKYLIWNKEITTTDLKSMGHKARLKNKAEKS